MSFGTIVAPDGKEYPLTEPVMTIGRTSSCDIHLIDMFATRNHAKFLCLGDEVFVLDLESVNGTFLNGVQLEAGTPTPLSDGDQITVGRTALTFRAVSKQA